MSTWIVIVISVGRIDQGSPARRALEKSNPEAHWSETRGAAAGSTIAGESDAARRERVSVVAASALSSSANAAKRRVPWTAAVGVRLPFPRANVDVRCCGVMTDGGRDALVVDWRQPVHVVPLR
jgi:hypothetical protein